MRRPPSLDSISATSIFTLVIEVVSLIGMTLERRIPPPAETFFALPSDASPAAASCAREERRPLFFERFIAEGRLLAGSAPTLSPSSSSKSPTGERFTARSSPVFFDTCFRTPSPWPWMLVTLYFLPPILILHSVAPSLYLAVKDVRGSESNCEQDSRKM